jgi:hypothetical protein
MTQISMSARRHFFWLALATLAHPWAFATPASAQTPIVLDSQLPKALQRCVSTERLQASYARARDRHAEASESQDTRALRVELRSQDDTRAEVTQVELRAFRGARYLGARVLPIRAQDCSALPETLALVLDFLSRSAPPEPDNPPDAPPAIPLVPQPIAADLTEPAPPPPHPSAENEWAVGLGMGAFFGALPQTAAALQLLAALRIPRIELRVHATVLWPQESSIAEGSVDMSAYELALEGCPTLQLEPWALRLCFGPRFGIVRASSRGFAVRNRGPTEFSLYLGAVPEVAFAVTATTWLQLTAGIALALQRPKFVVQFQAPDPSLQLDGPSALRAEIGLNVVQIF